MPSILALPLNCADKFFNPPFLIKDFTVLKIPNPDGVIVRSIKDFDLGDILTLVKFSTVATSLPFIINDPTIEFRLADDPDGLSIPNLTIILVPDNFIDSKTLINNIIINN